MRVAAAVGKAVSLSLEAIAVVGELPLVRTTEKLSVYLIAASVSVASQAVTAATVTFQGGLANTPVPTMAVVANGLTGGTSPTVSVTPTVAGGDKGGADKQVQLPFVLQIKRPNKSRLEIEFAGKTAIQVYDGTQGWKLRPFLNRNDVEPFTAQEAKAQAEEGDVVDALVDYAAQGTKVELEKAEPVEGHNAYKLKLTMKDGMIRHVWIDAQTFLDVKVEAAPRRMDGRMRNVSTFQRDFRTVQGLKIPFVMETVVDGFPQTHKVVIDKVVVNGNLDDARFAKPTVAGVAALPAAGTGS